MKLTVLHNEPDLIRLVAQGDEWAFRKIYDHYSDRLYNYVLKLTHNEEQPQLQQALTGN